MEFQDQSYEVKEIFGINSSEMVNQPAQIADSEKQCIVCCSEKIDTVIMPCRHMCLCIECAKSLQNSQKQESKKCPICRKAIESFLRLKNGQNTENTQKQTDNLPSRVYYKR